MAKKKKQYNRVCVWCNTSFVSKACNTQNCFRCVKIKSKNKAEQVELDKIEWNKKYLKYKSYLYSDEWKLKREELFKLRGKKCERCKSENRIEVHHISYSMLYREPLEHLEILCNICHAKHHNKPHWSD